MPESSTLPPNRAGQQARRKHRCRRIEQAAQDLSDAWDQWVEAADDGGFDQVAQAIGRLRAAMFTRYVSLAGSRYTKPRGVCAKCEKELPLTEDERLPAHDGGTKHNDPTGYCRGWGDPPKDHIVFVPQRQAIHADPAPPT
jgi:hypothetical protein